MAERLLQSLFQNILDAGEAIDTMHQRPTILELEENPISTNSIRNLDTMSIGNAQGMNVIRAEVPIYSKDALLPPFSSIGRKMVVFYKK